MTLFIQAQSGWRVQLYRINGGIWRGNTKLIYPAGATTGFAAEAYRDIAAVIYNARALGNATMKLTNVKAYGFDEEANQIVELTVIIETAETTKNIDIAYLKWDLTRDGKVDSKDLGVALLYAGWREDDPGDRWTKDSKVNNSKGKPVYAVNCDVVEDGVVDMVDLVDIYSHYTP